MSKKLANEHFRKSMEALEDAEALMTVPIHRFYLMLVTAIVEALWAIMYGLD